MITRFQKIPAWVLKILKCPPQVLYAVGFGPLIGGLVMLIKTRGCRTGKMRTTPLQYEWIGGDIYIASMRGTSAAWYRNLLADPNVEVRVGRLRGRAEAEPVEDPDRIVEFLQERLNRRPRMIGAMLKAEGIEDINDRSALLAYAARIALVRVRLLKD